MNYDGKIATAFGRANLDASRFMEIVGVLDSDISDNGGFIMDLNAEEQTVKYPGVVNNEPTFIEMSLSDRLTQSIKNIEKIKNYMTEYKDTSDDKTESSNTIDFLLQDIDIVNSLVDVFVETQYPNALYNALTAHSLPFFVPEPNYGAFETKKIQEFKDHKISARLLLESYAKDINKYMDYTVHNDLQMITSILDFADRNRIPLRRCPVCHKIFVSDEGNHKYCSDSCRRKGYKKSREQFVNEPLNRAIKNMKQRIHAVDLKTIDPEKLSTPYLSYETNALIDQARKDAISSKDNSEALTIALKGVTNDVRKNIKNRTISEEQAIELLNNFGRSRQYYHVKKN